MELAFPFFGIIFLLLWFVLFAAATSAIHFIIRGVAQ